MGLVAWVVLGAVAGFAAGVTLFDDEGLSGAGHVAVGAIAGAAGGFLSSWLIGFADPINAPSPQALIGAVIMAAVAVYCVDTVAQERGYGI